MFLKPNDILDKNDYNVTDAEVEQTFQNLGYITNTLSLKEFEEAIIANEITNFRPYVEEPFMKTATEKPFAFNTVSPKSFIKNGHNQMIPIDTMIGSNYS